MIKPVRDRAVFEQFRRARSARCGPVRVRLVPDVCARSSDVQVAYALSRRTGGAVVRNRVRRRLRAVIRDLDQLDASPLPRRSALLFTAEATVAGAPYPEVCRWVEGAVSRVTSTT